MEKRKNRNMGRLTRKPFQGIVNIIRFNWHYYAIAFIVITTLFVFKEKLPSYLDIIATIILLFSMVSIITSLVISYYIYDYSELYTLNWLNNLNIGSNTQLVNIHAGFDETSSLLQEKYPDSTLIVFDFYDPNKHTEISIKRARKAYPEYPNTKAISTHYIPLQANSVDYIFLILAAHEIRNNAERIDFFNQLANALTINGKIIVVEHQRDLYNFMAYNIGFLHFISNKTWKQTFSKAGLHQDITITITPFITTFILKKNGITT